MLADPEQIARSLSALAAVEPAFARSVAAVGPAEPRVLERGYGALLRIILGQQVSTASARAVFGRLEALLGDAADPARLLAQDDAALRAAGLSRQKVGHVRSLAALVASGGLDLRRLPEDDEAAVAALTAVKGVGRWTAEVYLLLAEQRADVWPAGDLAVRVGAGFILGLAERPSEAEARRLAEPWRGHRGVAALQAWRHYRIAPV